MAIVFPILEGTLKISSNKKLQIYLLTYVDEDGGSFLFLPFHITILTQGRLIQTKYNLNLKKKPNYAKHLIFL